MAETTLEYFINVLDADWQESYDGPAGTRINDVPKPKIVKATDKDEKRVDPRQQDVLIVRQGGPASLEPRGMQWDSRRRERLVSLDIRTTVSRERLEGTRDANNEREAYGGLRGETLRILDTIRRGDKEFDWIDGYEYRPLSEEMAFANWRGVWEVRLTTLAEDIHPP
jgi:hypothetical protein